LIDSYKLIYDVLGRQDMYYVMGGDMWFTYIPVHQQCNTHIGQSD